MHETAHFREDPFTGKYINTSINFTRSKAKFKKKTNQQNFLDIFTLLEAF